MYGSINKKKKRIGEGRAYAQPCKQNMLRRGKNWEVEETTKIAKMTAGTPRTDRRFHDLDLPRQVLPILYDLAHTDRWALRNLYLI